MPGAAGVDQGLGLRIGEPKILPRRQPGQLLCTEQVVQEERGREQIRGSLRLEGRWRQLGGPHGLPHDVDTGALALGKAKVTEHADQLRVARQRPRLAKVLIFYQ